MDNRTVGGTVAPLDDPHGPSHHREWGILVSLIGEFDLSRVIVNWIRFLAMDGQWYELSQDAYLRGTGAASVDNVVKALLAAGAAALIGVIVVGEATKGRPPA